MRHRVVHNYTLLHPLGEGGMAEVWYAESNIGKKAAVKILKEEFTKMASVQERFKNEAQVMVTLSHPHIRQVYDYGSIDSRPCIVMEYLNGADLSTRLKQGEHFSNSQLSCWWDNMVDILRYTHRQGVVHRDIKPSNIFITDAGELKLLDFGIAKIKGSLTLTQTGSRMGTLMYMSPEQVEDSKHLDHRSDYYSLAVTFYHLVSGRAPYDSHTESEFKIQTKIVTELLNISSLPLSWQKLLAPLLVKNADERGHLQKWGEADIPNDESTIIKPSVRTRFKEPQKNKIPHQNSGSRVTKWIVAGSVALLFVLLLFVIRGIGSSQDEYQSKIPVDSVSISVDSVSLAEDVEPKVLNVVRVNINRMQKSNYDKDIEFEANLLMFPDITNSEVLNYIYKELLEDKNTVNISKDNFETVVNGVADHFIESNMSHGEEYGYGTSCVWNMKMHFANSHFLCVELGSIYNMGFGTGASVGENVYYKCINYNTGEIVKLSDIVKPGTLTQELLHRCFKDYARDSGDRSVDINDISMDELYYPETFIFDEEAILFVFPKYDIGAAGFQGNITFKIPFWKIEYGLQPDFKRMINSTEAIGINVQ